MRSVLPIPLKNFNYLQAKVGGAETRKLPPIPQIGGFRGTLHLCYPCPQRLISKASISLQLEDVAISPGVRDPRLNTAECVTEGHTPNITATGRSSYVRTVIWSFCLYVFLMDPYLSSLILRSLNVFDNDNRHSLVKSAKGLSIFLFFCGIRGFNHCRYIFSIRKCAVGHLCNSWVYPS